jgi:hypothetical protein
MENTPPGTDKSKPKWYQDNRVYHGIARHYKDFPKSTILFVLSYIIVVTSILIALFEGQGATKATLLVPIATWLFSKWIMNFFFGNTIVYNNKIGARDWLWFILP